MKILRLTLKSLPFDAVNRGEKLTEYRKPSKWILSRLSGKSYDRVRFTNGYGPLRPYIEFAYNGSTVASDFETITYRNGLKVEVVPGDIKIHFSNRQVSYFP